ncbi:uncharacterized protein BJ171DRAFT_569206 [Polychytrium aggregatum]|uniref:uncharacterized protein n=1 Tax=Polychytrium aggregatum TaxID=110093 RepID=UPI0022FEDE72|nr:uncharacterized protein BJ171DRAFT_569206 [Polychytrium aggregatum]KAI9202920.1 hypothetical protein BJ171DRAFT_569206 [Polychytrium aggregatum]
MAEGKRPAPIYFVLGFNDSMVTFRFFSWSSALALTSGWQVAVHGFEQIVLTCPTLLPNLAVMGTDLKMERDWKEYRRTTSRNYRINILIMLLYCVSLAFNWSVSGAVYPTDLPGFITTSIILLGFTVKLPRRYHQILTLVSTITVLISFTLGSIPFLPFGILYQTSNKTVTLFGISATYQGSFNVVVVLLVGFISLSGITWALVCPGLFHGLSAFSISFSYIKVVCSGLLAAYAKVGIFAHSQKSLTEALREKMAEEVAFYLPEKNIWTGEFIYPIKNYVVPMRWFRTLARTVYRGWFNMRFRDKELEQSYLEHMNRKSIEYHLITVAINLMSTIMGTVLDLTNSAPITQLYSYKILRFIYFPIALIVPSALLVFKSIRQSPMSCQMIMLFSSIANISGYLVSFLLYRFLNVGGDPIVSTISSNDFHQSLADISIAIFSACAQSGLLARIYLPWLFLLLVATFVVVFVVPTAAPNSLVNYTFTAIPEACLVASVIGVMIEFESRKLFLLQSWASGLDIAIPASVDAMFSPAIITPAGVRRMISHTSFHIKNIPRTGSGSAKVLPITQSMERDMENAQTLDRSGSLAPTTIMDKIDLC